ncbi:MAG: hypothetical protein Q9M28_06820 [Mariprofundaceae bacterium]|nr:hypothetical protein [Mariprofundaceae bacterium]
MSFFFPVKQATLLIPSGPSHDKTRKHLFILLTDQQGKEKFVLIVSVSSVRKVQYFDSSCVLTSKDHEFIKHDSYVVYQKSRIEPASKLHKGVEEKKFLYKGLVDKEVLERICEGLIKSKHTLPKIKRFFMESQK